MTKCKACGKEIIFIKMKHTGKYMPCDPDLEEYREGGSMPFVTPAGEVIRGTIPFGIEPSDGRAYIPHWATCPCADEFRS